MSKSRQGWMVLSNAKLTFRFLVAFSEYPLVHVCRITHKDNHLVTYKGSRASSWTMDSRWAGSTAQQLLHNFHKSLSTSVQLPKSGSGG